MNPCKLCEQSTDFADAHAIPKFCFVPLRDGDRPPLRITNNADIPAQRAPIGEYDPAILCKACEPKFSEWDNYGKNILVDSAKSATPIQSDGKLAAYRLAGVDLSKLRMFFIAVLWRAAVSNRDFYKKISLGPFEAVAKTRILNRAPGDLNEFAIILSKWDEQPLVTSNPYPTRMDGLNFSIFEMLDYKVHIKIDKRPLPDDLKVFALGENRDVFMFTRTYGESKERKLLVSLAAQFRQRD